MFAFDICLYIKYEYHILYLNCKTPCHKFKTPAQDILYDVYYKPINNYDINSSYAGDGIFRLRRSMPCLLMDWLPKSPVPV